MAVKTNVEKLFTNFQNPDASAVMLALMNDHLARFPPLQNADQIETWLLDPAQKYGGDPLQNTAPQELSPGRFLSMLAVFGLTDLAQHLQQKTNITPLDVDLSAGYGSAVGVWPSPMDKPKGAPTPPWSIAEAVSIVTQSWSFINQLDNKISGARYHLPGCTEIQERLSKLDPKIWPLLPKDHDRRVQLIDRLIDRSYQWGRAHPDPAADRSLLPRLLAVQNMGLPLKNIPGLIEKIFAAILTSSKYASGYSPPAMVMSKEFEPPFSADNQRIEFEWKIKALDGLLTQGCTITDPSALYADALRQTLREPRTFGVKATDTSIYLTRELEQRNILPDPKTMAPCLSITIGQAHAGLTDMLLKFKPESFSDNDQFTPIHAAAESKKTAKALVCLSKIDPLALQSIINHPNKKGQTPLFTAAASLNADLVQWLLDHGAQPSITITTKSKKKSITVSCFDQVKKLSISHKDNLEKILDLVCNSPSFPTDQWTNVLGVALKIGSSAWVKRALTEGADPNARPFLIAAVEHSGMVFYSGDNITKKRKELHQIIQSLINAGSDLQSTDRSGWTPLHHACNLGLDGAVELLLRAGADPLALTSGQTPLRPDQTTIFSSYLGYASHHPNLDIQKIQQACRNIMQSFFNRGIDDTLTTLPNPKDKPFDKIRRDNKDAALFFKSLSDARAIQHALDEELAEFAIAPPKKSKKM